MKSQNDNLIEVKNLVLGFTMEDKFVNVLENVNFNIKKGEIVGLVGESGCGKSITSLTLMGLLPKTSKITSGQILYDGKDLLSVSPDEMIKIRGAELAMIFQEPMTSLNPVFTIGDQISEMMLLHTSMTKKEAWQSAIEKLTEVSIPNAENVVKQYPHQLSGGMRQRVMIAMAMALQPKVLIADEPTTALDVTIQAQILDLIKKLKTNHQTSILFITHDLGVVAETCNYVVVMYAGHIVEEADVYSIFENPKHPYTVGLMKSLPDLNETSERLYNIKGSVPAPNDYPDGCRFAPRCEKAAPQCYQSVPPLLEDEDGHKVRCFFPEE